MLSLAAPRKIFRVGTRAAKVPCGVGFLSIPYGDITCLLQNWRQGDPDALPLLIDRVYPELRKVAGRFLANHQGGSLTLDTTDLVHETYLKLLRQDQVQWQDRAHFFAVAARLIRRIVVDHYRLRHSQKRGSGAEDVPLEQHEFKVPCRYPNWLELDGALNRLAEIDQAACRVVELRYVVGLTLEETAEVMELGSATIGRHWRFARSWLRAQLTL